MANLGSIIENLKILDVGCGIGEPAFYLHNKYHCSIIGITISERGVELATKESRAKGFSKKVKFQLRDALNNGFPARSFDIVWQMESSHTMKDRKTLFSENYRVLKDNGTLLLCDMILKREVTVVDVFNYSQEIEIMEKVCGKAKTETLERYRARLEDAGFGEITTIDISEKVFPSMAHFRKNILKNQEKILQCFPQEAMDNFLLACDATEKLFRCNLLGYGLVKAVKNPSTKIVG
jgi:ubiquinone/menaquinone biosynthesis C-methylase UbiE